MDSARLRPGRATRARLAPCIAFLALCAAIVAGHYSLPSNSFAQGLAYQAAGVAAFVAVVVGTLLHRPSRTLHLWIFAGGLGLLSLGDAIWNVYDFVLEIERPYPSVADVAYLAGYGAIAAALLHLIRSRQRPNLSDVADGLIVLAGSALLLWFALIEPAARDAETDVASRVVSAAYPAMDVLLLVVLAQLVLTSGARSFAFRAITLGAAVLFGTDVVYGLQTLSGTYVAGGWLDAGWMLSTSLWGAAALHPSIRTLHRHAPLRDTRLTWRRLALLSAATLVTPYVLVVYLDRSDALDVGIVAAAAAATVLLVLGRMALLFRDHAHAVAELRDARAREDVERVLRASNERFQAAATALDCAIYELNGETGQLLWSEGLFAAFGHRVERADPTNEWFLDHVHPDDRAAVEEGMRRCFSGGEVRESNYRFLAGDGTYRDVWDRWTLVTGDAGGADRVIGGMVDVTDRRELERRLQQSQKMEAVGRLAGGIAHDFNNLLLAISGNAELLADSPALDADERQEIADILGATHRAAELTRQLLTFSRGQREEAGSVALNETVAGVESLLRRLLGAAVEIETSLDPEVGSVVGASSGIEQILVNLAVNARDAMPAGGAFRIATEVEPAGGSVRLVVEDTGVGMDELTASRAFDPFFTTKELGKGTGLGLATVYGIVEQSGGTVAVVTSPGEGARFEIVLPVAESATEPEQAPAGAGGRGSERILLVEDEPAVRDIVAKMLEGHGYDVVAAEGPLEALELLLEGAVAPDLVVSDLVMPKLSGLGLAERVEELRPGTRFLFISGFTGHSVLAEDGLPEGLALVQKPFSAAELTGAVRQALAADAAPAL